jgi:hypothetical protein
MWVFIKDQGFFSAVQTNSIKKSEVMVRARCYEDLQKLLVAIEMPEEKIHLSPGADYIARIIIPKEKWAKYLAAQAMAIDYPNFKDTVDDSERYYAYSGAWLALKEWQVHSKLAQTLRRM